MTTGAFNWINEAVAVLKNVEAGSPADLKKVDELLSGVPVPNVDLGFDSPADRAARDEELFAQARAHMEKYSAAASLSRELWDATVRIAMRAYVNSGVGYKLVPQEPTLEMQMAGAQCGPGAENQGKLMDAWSVYRRMVQASPSISARAADSDKLMPLGD